MATNLIDSRVSPPHHQAAIRLMQDSALDIACFGLIYLVHRRHRIVDSPRVVRDRVYAQRRHYTCGCACLRLYRNLRVHFDEMISKADCALVRCIGYQTP